jgi:hypothetical protein
VWRSAFVTRFFSKKRLSFGPMVLPHTEQIAGFGLLKNIVRLSLTILNAVMLPFQSTHYQNSRLSYIALRRHRSLTQAAVAEAVGLNRVTYARGNRRA